MATDERVRWEQIERLLDAALDASPADGHALLQQARREDPALADRVETLLHAAESAEGFLPHPAQEFAAGLIASMADEMDADDLARDPPLQRVGPYRLLHEVGRGGMGAVFLAERDDDEYRRRVAVKIAGSSAIRDLTGRFIAERQILASLDHPNIARLYDGGTTADGTPYLVMEYIDGRRIDAYCDERRLSVASRLALFAEICAAVQFAHQKLVVHRDLKPANVLVTDDGVVKLLDFGVAKLLDDGAASGAATPLTRTGMRAMTPEYASPEQLRGDPISTSTDVYALGLLLYELLTGRRAYRLRGRSPGEIDHIVQEQVPTKPSAAVVQARDKQPGGHPTPAARVSPESERRGTTIDGLRRRLRGDLDTIVLAALQKQPARRYASVDQLLDDIRRHLDGRPVSAQADSSVYRLRKFVGRHRLGVAAAAVFVLLLLGFSLVTAIQSSRIRAQAERITEERDKAEQVAGFLTDLFEKSNPYSERAGEITAREMLDRGAVRIDSELVSQPELRAEMMFVMARAYDGLGLHGEFRRLMESSLEIQQRVYGDDDPRVAGTLTQLAHAHIEQGDYPGAEALLRRSLAIRRTASGADHPYVARTMNSLAQALREQERYAEAESLLREALAIDRQYRGEDGADVAQSLRGLAHLLRDRGEYAAAEPYYRQALALHRERYGEEHPEVANSMINLAAILHAQGNYAAAEPLFRQGLSLKRRLLGDENEDVAVDMVGFAVLLHDMGDDVAAERLYRQALAVHLRIRPEGLRAANALLGLGELLRDRGDAQAAAPFLRHALTIQQRVLPPGHSGIAQAQSALGEALSILGRFGEAEPLLLDGYATLREARGDDDAATRRARQAMIAHYRRAGRPDQAALRSERN